MRLMCWVCLHLSSKGQRWSSPRSNVGLQRSSSWNRCVWAPETWRSVDPFLCGWPRWRQKRVRNPSVGQGPRWWCCFYLSGPCFSSLDRELQIDLHLPVFKYISLLSLQTCSWSWLGRGRSTHKEKATTNEIFLQIYLFSGICIIVLLWTLTNGKESGKQSSWHDGEAVGSSSMPGYVTGNSHSNSARNGSTLVHDPNSELLFPYP